MEFEMQAHCGFADVHVYFQVSTYFIFGQIAKTAVYQYHNSQQQKLDASTNNQKHFIPPIPTLSEPHQKCGGLR